MAIFGGIGKRLGLGTAEQIVTRATGSRLAGAIAGEVSAGIGGLGRQLESNIGQGTAVSTSNIPPAETAMSGERGPAGPMPGITNISYQPAILRSPAPVPQMRLQPQQAGLPAIIGGGGLSFGRALLFGGAAATIAPTIIDEFGQEKKLRVTRRLRSQVKRAVEMFGVEAVAEQMGTDVEVIFYILTKKMRNDGPYVTKAAVRKTRQTVRKMKHLCDMYDDLRPAAKRRAPTRRTSSVTQIKN
jgi:hypothetical protein